MPPSHPRVNATTQGLLNAAVAVANNAFFDTLGNKDYQPSPVILGAFQETTSKGAMETYAQPESVPRAKYWPVGNQRMRAAFGEVYQSLVNYNWENSVQILLNALEDDRTGNLIRSRIQEAASRFLQLIERIMVQILLSSTDPELLPTLPTSYDGFSLFSTSHSFHASGNILTGSGVATETQLLTDLYAVIERAGNVTDTESEPYFPAGVQLDQIKIIAGNRNREAWAKVLKSVIIPGGLVASSNVSNPVMVDAAQLSKRIYFTPRITTDDWYAYLDIPGRAKPLIRQRRKDVQMIEATLQNSDRARDTRIVSFDWDSREGWGVLEPRMMYFVNN